MRDSGVEKAAIQKNFRSKRMKKKFKPRKTPFILIGIFLLLLLIGLAAGEPTRVLEQAKAVCLACIGIG
jgi:hypothetical protein